MRMVWLGVGIAAASSLLTAQETPSRKAEMSTQSHTLELNAPREKVFEFLSKVENLPKWAVVFCRGLERRDGRWWAKSPDGEMIVRFDADAKTGVIDMYAGPAEDQMMLAPTRVIGLPNHRSLFLFTVIKYPGMSDEAFKAQCVPLVEKEFPALRRHVE